MDFDELNDRADKGELTEAKLQEELNNYAAALRSEFEESSKSDPENVEQHTRDYFKKNVHSAAAQIVWLSLNSTSDATRLAASKFIVEAAHKDARSDGDPIRDLLKELSKTPATPASAAKQGVPKE